MDNKFITYQSEEKRIIESLAYPKFKAVVNNISDIEDIEIDEDILDARDITIILKEAEDFLKNYNPKGNE